MTWVEDPKNLNQAIRQLEAENVSRRSVDKTLLRLYYERPLGVGLRDPTRPYTELADYESLRQLGFNLTRELVDAGVAAIVKPMRAVVVPVGGEFETLRRTRGMQQLLDGVMRENRFLEVAGAAFRDGCTTTMGAVKWFIDENSEIRCERLDPLSLYWHYDEGTDPIHLYYSVPVPRAVLQAKFPKHADKIASLPVYRAESIVGVEFTSLKTTDTVQVNEAWRRKIVEKNGRHAITAGDDIVLLDEPWTYQFLPVVVFRWTPDLRGYGSGKPLAEMIAPYHIWSNLLVRQVYDSLKGAVPWLLSHEGSLVDEVSDLPFQRIAWHGQHKPEIHAPAPVSVQVLQEIDKLRDRAYQETGISQAAAAGTRPAGLNSEPAQRAWVDIGSARLSIQRQIGWEAPWRDSGRIIIALAAEAYQSKGALTRAPGTEMLSEVMWRDVDLQEDKYRVEFSLTSGLSQTISGKIEQLEWLHDRDVIDKAEMIRQLDLPDIKQANDRANAPRDLVERQIWSALSEGKLIVPSSMQGESLKDLVVEGGKEYQRAVMLGTYPFKNMEVLRRLIEAAKARIAPPPAPPAPPAPAPTAEMTSPPPVAPAPDGVMAVA